MDFGRGFDSRRLHQVFDYQREGLLCLGRVFAPMSLPPTSQRHLLGATRGPQLVIAVERVVVGLVYTGDKIS